MLNGLSADAQQAFRADAEDNAPCFLLFLWRRGSKAVLGINDGVTRLTLGMRKPAAKLNRADFAAHPVWEWALDEEGVSGQDETWVRPTEHQAVPAAAFAQFLVSASATLKDGSLIPACIEVTVAAKAKRFSPMFVFMLDRQLPFAGAETTRALSRYTKMAGNSPKRWELSVPLAGETRKRKGRAHSLAFGVLLNVFELVMARHMKQGRGN